MKKNFIFIIVLSILLVGCNNTKTSDIDSEANDNVNLLKSKIEELENRNNLLKNQIIENEVTNQDKRVEKINTLKEKIKRMEIQKKILKSQIDDKMLAKIGRGGKFGFINLIGETVIKPEYEETGRFSEGFVSVKKNDKWGFIDHFGNKITDFVFDDRPYKFKDGYASMSIDNKYGWINSEGKTVIEPRFDGIDHVSFFGSSTALVKVEKDGKYGYVNLNDEIIIDLEYDELGRFSEGLAPAKINRQWGYIDLDNNVVIKPQYEYGRSFGEGLAPVKIGNYWKYINKEEEIIIDKKFLSAAPFKNDKASVTIEGVTQVGAGANAVWMDRSGKIIENSLYIDEGEARAYADDNGLYHITKDGKQGFIDNQGNIVIALKFNNVHYFSHGLARFEENNQWGYINTKGEVVVAAKYDLVMPFYKNLGEVHLNGKKYFINTEGEKIEGDELLNYDVNRWYSTKENDGYKMLKNIKGQIGEFRNVLE